MSSGYIYLLQPQRSITNNEQIYKIGKTKRENFKRFNEYPVGSILLLQSSCKNCDLMERRLLNIFDEHFIKETDYGREYYHGDLFEMKKVINSEIMNEEVDIDFGRSIDYDISPRNLLEDRNHMPEKVTKKYCEYKCEICSFITTNKSKYNLHNLTEKHKKNENVKKSQDHSLLLCCEKCNTKYKSRVGLWRHSKICNKEKEMPINENFVKNTLNTDMFMEVIKHNKDLQNMLTQQVKDHIDLVNKLIEREPVK